jgi:hypothetical protein
MNVESTLNQRLNLHSTLIQHCVNVVCLLGYTDRPTRTFPYIYRDVCIILSHRLIFRNQTLSEKFKRESIEMSTTHRRGLTYSDRSKQTSTLLVSTLSSPANHVVFNLTKRAAAMTSLLLRNGSFTNTALRCYSVFPAVLPFCLADQRT